MLLAGDDEAEAADVMHIVHHDDVRGLLPAWTWPPANVDVIGQLSSRDSICQWDSQ